MRHEHRCSSALVLHRCSSAPVLWGVQRRRCATALIQTMARPLKPVWFHAAVQLDNDSDSDDNSECRSFLLTLLRDIHENGPSSAMGAWVDLLLCAFLLPCTPTTQASLPRAPPLTLPSPACRRQLPQKQAAGPQGPLQQPGGVRGLPLLSMQLRASSLGLLCAC